MLISVQNESVKVENVQVQLNPQVIIRAGDHEGMTGLDQGLTIQLPEGLHSEQGYNLYTYALNSCFKKNLMFLETRNRMKP